MPKAPRQSSGKFERKCKCHTHNTAATVVTTLYKLNRSDKKLRRDDVEYLVSAGHVERPEYGYICKRCFDRLMREKELPVQVNRLDDRDLSDIPSSTTHDTAATKVEDIKGNTHEHDLKNICSYISSLVKLDIASLFKDGIPTTDSLLSYSPRAWLEARPPQLIELICSICDIDKHDERKTYILAKAVEQIYYLRNSRLILPLSFRESLITYTWTNSKQATTLKCLGSPSSSYSTVKRFLVSEAGNEINVPAGAVRCAYDNNQIIGKTHIITGTNKVPTSVMTSTSYVHLSDSTIQNEYDMKPEHWMWEHLSDDQEAALFGTYADSDALNLFRSTRNDHLCYYLKVVFDQQHKYKEKYVDYIDDHIQCAEAAKKEKICSLCGSENDPTYRSCHMPGCSGSLEWPTLPPVADAAKKMEPATSDAASSYKNTIPVRFNEVSVKPGEPEFVNPNSYQTIVTVIQNIGKRAGLVRYGGDTRQWLFLECDGLPYKIMRDIIDNVYICLRCSTSFYGKEKINSDDHRCFLIHGEQPLVREFDWLVPVMGLLHFEMNVARSFLKLNWDVFVSDIAYSVGFESKKAQEYCKKGSNHHKTWDLIQIMYIGLTQELLLPYVRECCANEQIGLPTVQGYWDWCESNVDPNYCHLQQMVLSYLHALVLFRVGVRHNDVATIVCGRIRSETLLYGQNHPKYQDILYRDMHDQVCKYYMTQSAPLQCKLLFQS